MDSITLTDALVVGGSLAALIASILAIYIVTLSLRVYRLTLTAYTNIRDALMQMAIQTAETEREHPAKPQPPVEVPQEREPEHRAVEEKPVRVRPEPYDTLHTLVTGENFKAALIFDESGQVIEYDGEIDASREAALLTEIINSLQLARSSVNSVQIRDGDLEILMPAQEVAGRRIYFYVRASKDGADVDFELLRESVRRIIGKLFGGG